MEYVICVREKKTYFGEDINLIIHSLPIQHGIINVKILEYFAHIVLSQHYWEN